MMKKTLLLLTPLLLLTGCSSSQTWGWYVIDPHAGYGLDQCEIPDFGHGRDDPDLSDRGRSVDCDRLLVALPGLSEKRGWRLVNRVYVEFIRAIPLLPMLFWVFYGLPIVCSSRWA